MSPIKAENRALYPDDWPRISASIRERAGGQCECRGECGLHATHPGPRRCLEVNGQPARWARGRVILTVHHLNCDPTDNRPENLRAMCQRCHLRCDAAHHRKNAAATRRAKRQNLELL